MTPLAQPCVGWDEDLSALIDGELEPARRVEVEAHVAGCAGCRERVAALRAVDERLAAIPLPEASGRRRPPRPAHATQPTPAPVPMPRARARARAAPPRDAHRQSAWWTSAPVRIAAAAVIALSLYWLVRPGSAPLPPPGGDATPTIAQAPDRAPDAGARLADGAPGERAPRQAPETIAERVPPPGPAPGAAPSLESASDDELALVFQLETVENLEVIANLELLERLVDLEEGRG